MIESLAGTVPAAALLVGVGLCLAIALGAGLVRRGEDVQWIAFGVAALAGLALSQAVAHGAGRLPVVGGELGVGFLTDGGAFFQVVVCVATAGAIVLVAYGRRGRPGRTCAWLLIACGGLVLLCGAGTVMAALAAVAASAVGVAGLLATADVGRDRMLGALPAAALAGFGLVLLAVGTEGARLDSLALPSSEDATALALPCGILTAAGVFGAFWLGWVASDSRTPAPVAAWLAAPAVAVAALALRVRLGLGVFDPLPGEGLGLGLGGPGWVSLAGSLVALGGYGLAVRARSLAGVSAALAVGQVGLLAVAVAGREGVTASLAFQAVSLVLTQLTVFALVAVARAELGGSDSLRLRGLARRNPWLAGFLALGLASAVGFPATAGFVGELQAMRVVLSAELFLPGGLALLSGVLGLAAVTRVLRGVYFAAPAEPENREPLVTSPGLTIVCAALAATTLWLGLSPAGLVGFTQQLHLAGQQ